MGWYGGNGFHQSKDACLVDEEVGRYPVDRVGLGNTRVLVGHVRVGQPDAVGVVALSWSPRE